MVKITDEGRDMTDIQFKINALREHLQIVGLCGPNSTSESILANTEAALFPTPGPAPDPAKQFVVGELYSHEGRTAKFIPALCEFVTKRGYIVLETPSSIDVLAFGSKPERGNWKHVPRNPALDRLKAERESVREELAVLDAKVKEMETVS